MKLSALQRSLVCSSSLIINLFPFSLAQRSISTHQSPSMDLADNPHPLNIRPPTTSASGKHPPASKFPKPFHTTLSEILSYQSSPELLESSDSSGFFSRVDNFVAFCRPLEALPLVLLSHPAISRLDLEKSVPGSRVRMASSSSSTKSVEEQNAENRVARWQKGCAKPSGLEVRTDRKSKTILERLADSLSQSVCYLSATGISRG